MKGQSEEGLMDKRLYLFTLTFSRDITIDVHIEYRQEGTQS